MNMILFVLHDPEKLTALLDAWREAGATGATVMFSTGLGRLHQSNILRDDIPLMPSLEDFLPKPEHLSRTVFTIVQDEATVQRVITRTRVTIGDLSQPDTGVLVVLPVVHVEGLEKTRKKAE